MKTWIDWFARNGVAANLLMIVVIAGGVITLPALKREVFPTLPTNVIRVSVVYPGAAPEEVEEAICIRVEEAVAGLEGVEQVTSTASENRGSVLVQAIEGTDIRRLLDDVKAQVDAIDTFPEDAEEPQVVEIVVRRQVVNVALHGDAEETSLKRLGERVRDEILALPGVTQADLVNVRPYEIAVEVSEESLRRYRLTFDDVANAVRRSSLDLPGGVIKSAGGEILLRTEGQVYRGAEFADLVLLSRPDGSEVRLGDVANVVDGFAETDQFSRFDGKPSVTVQVYRVGDQDAVDIVDAVKAYVREAAPRLPEGISLTLWQDATEILKSRQDLLIRNGRTGFVLVFLVLALFLRLRLAFWVSLGIPLSFLATLWVMPSLGVTINLISLFAFLIVLGIVVDDAIVVGESVAQELESGKHGVAAAAAGAKNVALPVVFSVLTTVAAFSPLLGVGGSTGQVMRVVPLIVIPTLLFSLVESLFILPSHLSHLRPPGEDRAVFTLNRLWRNVQDRVASGLDWAVKRTYQPALRWGLTHRYLVIALFTLSLFITVGLVGGGWVKFVFFPRVESDTMVATVTMPEGTPVEITARAVARLEASLGALEAEYRGEDGLVRHVLASIGEQPLRGAQASAGPGGRVVDYSGAHLGEVAVELKAAEKRRISSPELVGRWRELTGPIADAQELTFSASLFTPGEPINVRFSGRDMDELEIVAEKLKVRLADFSGVFDITDSHREGKGEIELRLKPGAEATGVTLVDLARQVRQAFYGEEAQRIQRGRDDVRIMVRFPAAERRSVSDLENMRIRAPGGTEVPLLSLADVSLGRGVSSIERNDRRRTLAVTADVDPARGNARDVLTELQATVLPGILRDHPGVVWSFEGQQEEQRETLGDLRRGFLIALIAIYALMAVPFKSYWQPFVVMSAIPFGLVGAVWGHVLLGLDLTILSVFGLVALSGVVVNDAIVLVSRINEERIQGRPLLEAVQEAGPTRFRAVLLTSLTTVAGLTPIMLEKSVQAQFLIPIAVSLAFGVLFATFITLMLVPVSYVAGEDLLAGVRRLWTRLLAGIGHDAQAAE